MIYLKDIAEIRPGHPFRGKLNEDTGGNVSVLQLKDITNSFFIDPDPALRLEAQHTKTQYLLEERDIVFRSRGHTNTCAILQSLENPAICAAPLFSIRVTDPSTMPEFICWLINQPEAQAYIDRNAKGTSARMIDRKALENLPISLPPREKQQEITAIAKLADQEQRLMTDLAEKKKKWISGILTQVASETGNKF